MTVYVIGKVNTPALRDEPPLNVLQALSPAGAQPREKGANQVFRQDGDRTVIYPSITRRWPPAKILARIFR